MLVVKLATFEEINDLVYYFTLRPSIYKIHMNYLIIFQITRHITTKNSQYIKYFKSYFQINQTSNTQNLNKLFKPINLYLS